MNRLLEASLEETFNSVVITEARARYPIIYVNSAFCNLTGYGPHEVIGKSPSMLQGQNTAQAVLERLNNDISEGRLFHSQAINYRKERSGIKMEWKILPIRNEKNEIPHYHAVQKDIG